MCKNSEVAVPLPDNIAEYKQNRTVSIDFCIVDAIKHLWSKGYQTLGCCCGHGKENPSVIVADGYGDVDILAVYLELSQVDKRDWDIFQWRLIKIEGVFNLDGDGGDDE